MYIRNDGFCTDSKSAIKLFDTVKDAEDFLPEWRATTSVRHGGNLSIVEVETKLIVKKFGKTVKTL
jgi:hypothetical protein